MAARSPASSPRLPSPPPIAEDQVGPLSPSGSMLDDSANPGNNANAIDTGAMRRIRPGTKAEDMAEGPPLVELQDIDSAFQLTEHLKSLHHTATHPPNSSNTQPITAHTAASLSHPPPNTSRDIWLYELGRFLIQKTNAVLIALFADTPPCSPQTCPEMRASEWQYLCAVHDPPKSCAAIDYCCHTLDWAATTLSSSKMFPSRLGLGSGGAPGQGQADRVLAQQMKEIKNIFRRVYRIYAHAWFQHREAFWRFEMRTGLYGLFKRVCDEYGIIEADSYTIPAEAEGLGESGAGGEMGRGQAEQKKMSLLSRGEEGGQPVGNNVVAAGETTKRHRHTPSDRASSISTVIQEEAEEEEAEENTRQGQQQGQEHGEEHGQEQIAETGEESPKPGVERQATALKDTDRQTDQGDEKMPGPEAEPEVSSGEEAQQVQQKTEAEEEQEPEPEVKVQEVAPAPGEEEETPEAAAQGISRSQTAKPPKEEGADATSAAGKTEAESEGTAKKEEEEEKKPEEPMILETSGETAAADSPSSPKAKTGETVDA